MTSQEDFLKRIGDLRKQAIRRAIARIMADTLIFSLAFNIGAIAVQKAESIDWEGYGIYPLLVLLAIGISTLIEIRKRRRFVDELIDIDLRFHLKEMLSSAYECLKLGRRSMCVDFLIEDASRFLSRIGTEELLPTRLLRRHMLIPVLALVMILVLKIDFLPARTELNTEGSKILDQIALQMEKFSKRERSSSDKIMKKGRENLFKKMEELEWHLRNRSMNTEKVHKSLRDFIEEAHEAQASLASQFVEELSLQNIEGIPSFEPQLKKGIPSKNLEGAEALLGKFFEGEIPATVSEKILELKRYNQIQQLLAKTMDGLESDSRSDSKQESRLGPKQDKPSEMTENASSKHAGHGKAEASDGEGTVAGRGKDTQNKGPPHEIKASTNIPVKDPALVGPGKRYNVHIRSLPMVEKARVKPEDLIRSYRNEIEEVLTNDKIPLNYREYIKNYFLSIGVGREAGPR